MEWNHAPIDFKKNQVVSYNHTNHFKPVVLVVLNNATGNISKNAHKNDIKGQICMAYISYGQKFDGKFWLNWVSHCSEDSINGFFSSIEKVHRWKKSIEKAHL